MGDPNDRPSGDEPQHANNPEGEMTERPEDAKPESGLKASGEEAQDAGQRATADEPVSRRDVLDQSAYKDNSADVGQQAAHAEAEKEPPTKT